MQARYVSIWKLHGVNTLSADTTSIELARTGNPALVASVTSNPEPFFLHIDKSQALATQILKGLFGLKKDGALKERLAAEIATVKAGRRKQTEKGVFLLLEGQESVAQPIFRIREDTDEFAVCFDAIDKEEIRDRFRPFVQSALTAISLTLPGDADRQFERVGEVIYLLDPNQEKPIYSFSVRAGIAKVSLASPLTADIANETGECILKLIGDKTLARPASLLVTSLKRTTDALQAFIAAWSALEIFVNATFQAQYEARWFGVIEVGAPIAAKPVFERFKDVMSDKYRLADKFLIIAAVLAPNSAAPDTDIFRRLKTVRDNLLHALETPEHLPTEDAQKLLLKYLGLHLGRQL